MARQGSGPGLVGRPGPRAARRDPAPLRGRPVRAGPGAWCPLRRHRDGRHGPHRLPRSHRHPQQLRELGVHSLLALPLLARGRALGAAAFYRAAPSPPFSPDDVALARDLTSRAAVYLNNARLYTREHTTAVTLQRSLLPYRLTPPPGIEVAHCYRPASEAQEAGGDWYDVVAVPGGLAALMVGDVMGHGIVAAAAMGRLRSTMRALARLELPPEQLLPQLDATLADSPGTPLATCVYAVCDPVAGSCSITRAGHLPPVVVRPGGSAEPLQLPTGVPLGVGGGDFVPTEVPLPPGSVLALYTDGLVEVRGADLDERVAQLCDVLTAGSALPLNDLGRSAVVSLAPAPPDRGRAVPRSHRTVRGRRDPRVRAG
ncbi:SpoIIE family protein phosphatase [Streptomyces sp. ARC32]